MPIPKSSMMGIPPGDDDLVFIMHDYCKSHPTVSFCSYAVPRQHADVENKVLQLGAKATDEYLRRFEKARFLIYRYAMFNLFLPADFAHRFDEDNNVYIMLNRLLQGNHEDILQRLIAYLKENEEIIFSG